jgi:hypothetical protein
MMFVIDENYFSINQNRKKKKLIFITDKNTLFSYLIKNIFYFKLLMQFGSEFDEEFDWRLSNQSVIGFSIIIVFARDLLFSL